MANKTYNQFSTLCTPQTSPVPGENMVKNKAGGYAFLADKWTRLRRFLVLGSDGGTYYTSAKKLTEENVQVVRECAQEDVTKTLEMIVEISDGGLAPSNDPALFALAFVCAIVPQESKGIAYNALPKVARTAPHLYDFVSYSQNFRGWGRRLRKAVASWYVDQDDSDMVYQLVKYRQRNGWTHADILRKCHAIPKTLTQRVAFKWATGKGFVDSEYPSTLAHIRQYEFAKRAKSVTEVVNAIREAGLPWEAVPTEWHKHPQVWETLLEKMPVTALIRNLGRFANLGMTASNMSDTTKYIVDRLSDISYLQRGRIHPMKILMALRVYQAGRGDKGKLTWTPNQRVADALNEAFYLTFGNVRPTGLKLLVAVDESRSMRKAVSGAIPMSCYEAGLAMSLVLARTEPNVDLIGFDTRVHDLSVSPTSRLDYLLMRGASGGGTDCSLPFAYALRPESPDYDAIVAFSDDESWAGGIHQFQIAASYRKTRNAKLRYVAGQMAATETSLIKDATASTLDLEVVGLDTSVPELVRSFLLSEF